MKHNVIGMDIAKNVFQLHTVDSETGEIERIKLRRSEVLAFFVQRNKTDMADARAIWTAAQQPEARFVAIKTEQQQAMLALHRMRAQLMKFRIMQTNALRGLLYEFGVALPAGYPALAKAWLEALAVVSSRLPAMLIDSLREQWGRVQSLDKEIAAIERRLADTLRTTEQCKKLTGIPGVGLLTATAAMAAMATIGDVTTFKSGREFTAWLGLVPRQTDTGGRIRQLGLSKRGDVYLRTLLIHGARAIIACSQRSPGSRRCSGAGLLRNTC